MVSSTPRPYFTPGKDPVPIVQEAGWAPGPVWRGGKSRPTGIRSPDRPARSQSLYRLSYSAHMNTSTYHLILYYTNFNHSTKIVRQYGVAKPDGCVTIGANREGGARVGGNAPP